MVAVIALGQEVGQLLVGRVLRLPSGRRQAACLGIGQLPHGNCRHRRKHSTDLRLQECGAHRRLRVRQLRENLVESVDRGPQIRISNHIQGVFVVARGLRVGVGQFVLLDLLAQHVDLVAERLVFLRLGIDLGLEHIDRLLGSVHGFLERALRSPAPCGELRIRDLLSLALFQHLLLQILEEVDDPGDRVVTAQAETQGQRHVEEDGGKRSGKLHSALRAGWAVPKTTALQQKRCLEPAIGT
mmetsp:Transcript_29824/g.86568  ORF Transcript_29824/g.86568 Transcript_29824/m.86568 type:complete len:242 (-) Transcript_29824:8-733(-)